MRLKAPEVDPELYYFSVTGKQHRKPLFHLKKCGGSEAWIRIISLKKRLNSFNLVAFPSFSLTCSPQSKIPVCKFFILQSCQEGKFGSLVIRGNNAWTSRSLWQHRENQTLPILTLTGGVMGSTVLTSLGVKERLITIKHKHSCTVIIYEETLNCIPTAYLQQSI